MILVLLKHGGIHPRPSNGPAIQGIGRMTEHANQQKSRVFDRGGDELHVVIDDIGRRRWFWQSNQLEPNQNT
jgi:hypothetical protein